MLLQSELGNIPASSIIIFKGDCNSSAPFFFISGFSNDVLDEVWLATYEVGVCIDIFAFSVAYLLEGVDVELADKGGHVMVFVVGRQDFLGESGNIADEEGIACDGPGNNVG